MSAKSSPGRAAATTPLATPATAPAARSLPKLPAKPPAKPPARGKQAIDFTAYRKAFFLIENAWRLGMQISGGAGGYRVGVGASRNATLSRDATLLGSAVAEIIDGPERDRPERRNIAAIAVMRTENAVVAARREGASADAGAVWSITQDPKATDAAGFSIGICRTDANGRLIDGTQIDTATPGWRETLAAAHDWAGGGPLIAAAEGNNQRAAIGAALQAAGIGRGRLEIIEIPAIDDANDATTTVRGVEILRSGIPRFRSALAEAMRVLLLERATHIRTHVAMKQGYYTALAVQAVVASGGRIDEAAAFLRLDPAMAQAMSSRDRPAPDAQKWRACARDLVESAPSLDTVPDALRASAWTIWKGAAVYAAHQARRQEAMRKARLMISEGAAIPDLAAALNIRRRTLIELLSVSREDIETERSDFLARLVRPEDFLRVAANR